MKKLLIITTILVFATILNSAWIDNLPSQLVQPDGTVIDVLLSGDEFHNWAHDENGFTIIPDIDTGFYCWAIPSPTRSGDVVSSGYPIHLHTPQSIGLQPRINISEELYLERRAYRDIDYSSREARAPTIGTVNNIVIFIRFSDHDEFTWTHAHMDNMFNNSVMGANSLHRYFYDASYEQLNVWGHFFPTPGLTILSYQSPNPRSFYNITDTNPQFTSRLHGLLQRAVNHVAHQVPADLVIDSTGNGRVDNVIFMVRGISGSWASLLWSHRWTLHSINVQINGKRVWDYNFNMQDHVDNASSGGVGLLVHEFGHSLGAPDFYRYNNNGTPIDRWEVMANQTNPPQSMSTHVKRKYMGWTPEIPVITSSGVYTLSPNSISQTNHSYRINSPNSTSEYFVVEYRSTTASLTDSQLPGSGLIVYRINPSINGNAQGPPDEIYAYRPGGTSPSVNGTVLQAFYSAQSGRTAINSTTSPTPFLQNGSAGGLNITNIGTAGSDISFTVTLPPASPIPYSENFNSGTNLSAIGWSGDLSSRSGIRAGSGVGGTNALTLNVYGTVPTQTAFSPRIGPATALANLSFEYRIVNYTTNWTGSLVATTLSANDKIYIDVLISGIYTPIYEINSLNHTTSTAFATINQSLSTFADSDIILRFRPVRTSGDWVVVIDDVVVQNIAAPFYSISPTTHNFGEEYVGSISTTQTFTITNTGTTNLSITDATLAGTDYSYFSLGNATELPWTIVPAGTRTFTATFSPASVGYKSASISITHNATGSPSTLLLSGYGVQAEFCINPTEHYFGEVYVDSTSTTQTFTITNTGTANLSITEVFIDGDDQNYFSLDDVDGLPWSITPDETHDFTVSFSPSSIGLKTADISITHNANGSPSSVTLSGNGVPPPSELSFTLINDNTAYEVSHGTANTTHIEIPETHLGLPVVAIADNGFANVTTLTSIDIPDSITMIGISAFLNCSGLTDIIIPDSVTLLGIQAFAGCESLISIVLSNSLTTIEKNTFYQCFSLISITIPSNVTSIGDYAFGYCTDLTTIHIPTSVTSIGEYAFWSCTDLTSATFESPSSLTSIATGAFSNCISLTEITIPSSVTTIGASAFKNCSNLTLIDIPIGVTSLEENAFLGCSNLTIYVAAANPATDSTSPARDWHASWNPDNRPVVWGCSTSDDDFTGFKHPTMLKGNYPNPFNPETTIMFTVGAISTSSEFSIGAISTSSAQVSINIYNIRGQLVRKLVDGTFQSGDHSVVWNGIDDNGQNVGSGFYFYRMTTGDFTAMRKMILMK
jgi:M6 family metalloprotease-like protein